MNGTFLSFFDRKVPFIALEHPDATRRSLGARCAYRCRRPHRGHPRRGRWVAGAPGLPHLHCRAHGRRPCHHPCPRHGPPPRPGPVPRPAAAAAAPTPPGRAAELLPEPGVAAPDPVLLPPPLPGPKPPPRPTLLLYSASPPPKPPPMPPIGIEPVPPKSVSAPEYELALAAGARFV